MFFKRRQMNNAFYDSFINYLRLVVKHRHRISILCVICDILSCFNIASYLKENNGYFIKCSCKPNSIPTAVRYYH